MTARLIIHLGGIFKSETIKDAARNSISGVILDRGAATEWLCLADDFKEADRFSYTFKGVKSQEAFEAAVMSGLTEWKIARAVISFVEEPTQWRNRR